MSVVVFYHRITELYLSLYRVLYEHAHGGGYGSGGVDTESYDALPAIATLWYGDMISYSRTYVCVGA